MLRQGNWGLARAASQDRALKLYPALSIPFFSISSEMRVSVLIRLTLFEFLVNIVKREEI